MIRHYHGHLSGVYALSLHPTLDVLVTSGRDASARVWDMRTKANIHVLAGHTGTVADVKCQESDPQVITGSMDSTVRYLGHCNFRGVFIEMKWSDYGIWQLAKPWSHSHITKNLFDRWLFTQRNTPSHPARREVTTSRSGNAPKVLSCIISRGITRLSIRWLSMLRVSFSLAVRTTYLSHQS